MCRIFCPLLKIASDFNGFTIVLGETGYDGEPPKTTIFVSMRVKIEI